VVRAGASSVAATGWCDVRFGGPSPYVDAQILHGDMVALMRLRYGGSAARWGFEIQLASKDRDQDGLGRHDISLMVSPYVVLVLDVTTACVLAAQTSRIGQHADLVDQRAWERCPR
jgi:hypothetical protein